MPGMGSPGKVRQGKHAGIRLWRVRDFENHLIAYRAHPLAKQDYRRILR